MCVCVSACLCVCACVSVYVRVRARVYVRVCVDQVLEPILKPRYYYDIQFGSTACVDHGDRHSGAGSIHRSAAAVGRVRGREAVRAKRR